MPASPIPGSFAQRTSYEEALVEDENAAALSAYPCSPAGIVASIRDFFTGLLEAFGPKFTAFIALNYFFVKGMAYLANLYVQLPYFKGLGVDGSDYQKFYNITQMAFALKPAFGVLSDSFPIFGFHKRYYLLIMCVLGTVSTFGVNLLPDEKSSAPAATALFFMFVLAIATMDLLTEGKYSEVMAKDKTGHATNVVTWVWMCYMVGGTIAAIIEGFLAERIGARVVLWIIAPLTMILFIPSWRGWLPETDLRAAQLPRSPNRKFRRDFPRAVGQHKGTLALGVLSSAAALVLAILSLLTDRTVVLIGLVVLSVIALGSGFAVLPLVIAKANLFMFLRELCYLQINGVLDYYYTSDDTCVPGGPAFSYEYYQTLANIIGNVAGFAGTILFQKFFLKGTFRRIFWFTTFLKIFASMFDIIIVKRWNIDIGIPDKAFYIFGDAIVYQLTTMLDFMPSVVLMSRLCPPGMEATIFALLAGVSNFGQTSSRTIGYMVSDWLNIRSTIPCDYSNLPWLIAIGHCFTPLLILPLTILLLPPNRMSEPITDLDSRAPNGPDPETEDGQRMLADEAEDEKRRQATRLSQYAVFAAMDGQRRSDLRRSKAAADVDGGETTVVVENLATTPAAIAQ
jgi:folate/biopterin transporter